MARTEEVHDRPAPVPSANLQTATVSATARNDANRMRPDVMSSGISEPPGRPPMAQPSREEAPYTARRGVTYVPTPPPPRPESTFSRYKGLVLVLVACLGAIAVGAAIYAWVIVGGDREAEVIPAVPAVAAVIPREAVVPPKEAVVIPKEAQDHLLRGIELAAQRDYDRAILAFSRAMVAHPPYAAAYANRGVAYIQKQEYPKALADLEKAVALDPRDKMVRYNLAALWSLANDRARALQYLDQAFQLGFDDVDAIRRDRDFDSVRNDPGFRQLLQRHSRR